MNLPLLPLLTSVRATSSKIVAPKPFDYPIWARGLEVLGIVLFCGASMVFLSHLAVATASLSSELGLLLTVVIWLSAITMGFLLADLISGLTHFWCDHIASENTPVLGPIFVKHFLTHHKLPGDITKHDFIETNGNNFLASTLFLAPALVFCAELQSIGALFFSWVYLVTAVFLSLTNQSHKWAHQPELPQLVQFLQRKGLLLSGADHALHHRQPFNRHFCITSGILNKPLERLGFFTVLGAPESKPMPPQTRR